jgi:hypothetical protein
VRKVDLVVRAQNSDRPPKDIVLAAEYLFRHRGKDKAAADLATYLSGPGPPRAATAAATAAAPPSLPPAAPVAAPVVADPAAAGAGAAAPAAPCGASSRRAPGE